MKLVIQLHRQTEQATLLSRQSTPFSGLQSVHTRKQTLPDHLRVSHEIPLNPALHSQKPEAGWQSAPFWHVQVLEQFCPKVELAQSTEKRETINSSYRLPTFLPTMEYPYMGTEYVTTCLPWSSSWLHNSNLSEKQTSQGV